MSFVRGTVVSPHGPYRRPEGSVAGFHRFAHSAGPGIVRQRVEWIGSRVDGLMQSSKWQVQDPDSKKRRMFRWGRPESLSRRVEGIADVRSDRQPSLVFISLALN